MRVTAEMRWFWPGQCPPDWKVGSSNLLPEPEEDSYGAMNICGPRTGRSLASKRGGPKLALK